MPFVKNLVRVTPHGKYVVASQNLVHVIFELRLEESRCDAADLASAPRNESEFARQVNEQSGAASYLKVSVTNFLFTRSRSLK